MMSAIDSINDKDEIIEDIFENPNDPRKLIPRNEEENFINRIPPIKKKSFGQKVSSFFSNFKDFLLQLILLSASVSNFSLLNIPYTLCGVLFMFLLLNHTHRSSTTKFITVICLLVYSILVLVLKISFYLLRNKYDDWVEPNKTLLINLGIKYLEDETSNMLIFCTFISEATVILGTLLSILIRCLNKRYHFNGNIEMERNTINMLTSNQSNYLIISNIFICSISIVTLGITCANMSFMSIFYSFCIYLGLFLWSINRNLLYHFFLYYLLSFLFTAHILLTHTFNIYTLRKEYMIGSSDIQIVRWLGIMKMKTEVNFIFDFGLTVLGCCLSIVAVKITNSYKINKSKSFRDTGNKIEDEFSNVMEKSLLTKIKEILIKYIFSAYFVLHFCRLAIIYWTWRFSNYPTAGNLIWLFYSFLTIKADNMKFLTFWLAWPLLIYSYVSFMISNIPGFLDKIITDENREIFKQYAIEEFDYPILEFIPIQLTILIFSVLMRIIYTGNIYEDKGKVMDKKNVHVNAVRNTSTDLKESLIEKDNLIPNLNTCNNSDSKSNSRLKKEFIISFVDLLSKLLITNIDKITVIFMYFLAIEKVNLSHFILTAIFLTQLILPQMINKLCIYIIVVISSIFASEYILDLVKVHVTISVDFDNFLDFFIDFDLKKKSTEFFLPFIIYCFYIQYQNYNSTMFKSYSNDELSLKGYLEQKLHNKKFKSVILFLLMSIQEIYIWIILILFFCLICTIETYVSFAIELLLFFIVMYKFLNISTNNKKGETIIKYVWILITFCGVNTLLVYFYQFTALKYISDWYMGIENSLPLWMKNNLKIFGFERYTEELAIEFLPLYGSNFLSVLLLWELNRILEIKKELKENISIEDNNRKHKSSHVLAKSMTQVSDNKLIPVSYFKYYSYIILVFLCKTYWLLIFLSVCFFIAHFQISVAMILYIIIFCISFNLMFYSLVSSVNKFLNHKNIFFLSRLVRYNIIEKPRNIHTLKHYRKITFKYLVVSGMAYIFFTYVYTLMDAINNIDPIFTNETYDHIRSVSYMIGIFHDSKITKNFLCTIWGHILMICLISFDVYVQKLQNNITDKVEELGVIIKSNEEILNKLNIEKRLKKEEQKISFTRRRSSRSFFSAVTGQENIPTIKQQVEEEYQNLNVNSEINKQNKLEVNTGKRTESIDSKQSVHLNINDKNSKSRYAEALSLLSFDITKCPVLFDFIKIFKNYEEKYSNETASNQIHNISSKKVSLSFTLTLKRLLEELITFLILLSAIVKLNIFSFIYILIVFFLQIKNKSISRIYYSSVLISFLIILQTVIFLSNLSIKTDPTPNLELLKILTETLNVPWYPNYVNESWGFFLGLGVNYYQIKTLWSDFFVIIVCFLYLDNFTYSIYEEGSNTMRGNTKDKINYYLLNNKKSVKKAMKNLSVDEYTDVKNTLKLNFNIILPEFEVMKNEIMVGEIVNESKLDDSMYDQKTISSVIKKETNKSILNRFFHTGKKTLYLTIHNLILVITLILSMMNIGLISTFYIIFSLYYLYTSNNIVSVKPYSLPRVLDKFLRIFFLTDLLIQLAFQNPLNVYLKDYQFILLSIGINTTIDYEKGPDPKLFNLHSSSLTVLKALTYFFVSTQVLMYKSRDFKEFYVGFVLKKKDSIHRNSMVNSYLFNNRRIKLMDKNMSNRKHIDKALQELEIQLEKWNNKLNLEDKNNEMTISNERESILEKPKIMEVRASRPETDIEHMNDLIDSEKRLRIKNKLMEGLLVKLVILIHKNTTNYSFVEKENKEQLEISILRGETYIKTTFEQKIEKYVKKLDLSEFSEDKDEEVNKFIKYLRINDPKNLLFSKYLSNWYLFKKIFWDVSKFLMDNFQFIVFFFMFLNNFFCGTLISLFWPIAVFAMGLVEYPRPQKKFWLVCRLYASIILLIKFLIQLDFIKRIPLLVTLFSKTAKLKIGLETFGSTFSGGFFEYIIWDAILIFFLMMQEYILLARGLWEVTEPEIENVEEAYDRIFRAKAFNEELIHDHFEDVIQGVKNKNQHHNHDSHVIDFKDRTFPKIRNNKPGRDLYAIYTVLEMLLIVYLILFYTDMDQDKMFNTSGGSKFRQFSGTMVLIIFFHAIKAVLDRIIYLNQNRSNLEFEYVYYDKQTGEKISKEVINDLGENEYYTIYYQKETVNYPLIFKFVLQLVITFISHIFIFFYLPMMGNYNLQNSITCEITGKSSCNDFEFNFYIKFFYLIYSLYLFFSALQIHYGIQDMRNKSLFMRGDNIIYASLFKAYKAVPFLYELKLTIDWTCTPTCLDLFKWLKFESVYDLLFITHCAKKKEITVPIGKNIGIFNKLLMGGSSFVILLLILLGPLLIFSTLNPTNVVNNVTGASVELSICFQQGQRVFNNFTLFKNDYVESIQEMTQEPETWSLYGYKNSSKTKNFPMSQVQIIRMSDTSDTIWDIAGPHIETIKDRLEKYRNYTYNIYIGFKYNFQRPSPPDAKDALKKFDYPIYIPGEIDRSDIIKVLMDNIRFCNRTEIILDNFYNPAMRLSSQAHPKVIWDNEVFKNLSVATNFICDYKNGEIDYSKSYHTLRKYDDRDSSSSIIFHTFSDKVSTTSTNYDVITFYVSFIIVIGRIIRGALSGEAEKIILTEMPEPKSLINLCEGIKISRYRYDFEREEQLYYVLIDFMRSPEILKLLTKSSLKKLKERKEIHTAKKRD